MKRLFRLGLLSFFALVIAGSTANAAPIVCSATLAIGGGPLEFFEASVDPALSCTTPIKANNVFPSDLLAFGATWLAQDKDGEAVLPLNGANEDVLTITGANTIAGTFTIDPSDSQCGLEDCNVFAFGLKFGPVVVYWNLGNITAPTTFNWTTNRNALSNGAVYGRSEEFRVSAPEPGVMLLLATGATLGLRRRFTASR
jgi:hypothetical protein